MRKVKLTSEWLAAWSPKRREEVADGVCRGLSVRGGPSGAKTFYRWIDARAPGTDKAKRQRVALGRWAIDGGGGALSLGAARAAFLEARKAKQAEVAGIAKWTVEALALEFKSDRLAARERGAEEWRTIEVHILQAVPAPTRPVFGQWPASEVRRDDLAAVVRLAKEVRAVGSRRLGGPAIARAVLRDLNSIFRHGLEVGKLTANPADMRTETFGLSKTSRARVLDAQELKALFDLLDLGALIDRTAKPTKLSEVARLGIAFQSFCPTRSQSILGATWDEFDLASALWVIPPARLKMRNAKERQEARAFTVPLCSTAVAILRRLKELSGESPWVLASPKGRTGEPPRALDRKTLIRALARLCVSGRLKLSSRVTIHDLRRTWRSLAEELGVDDVTAEKALGHRTAMARAGHAQSADVYARSARTEQRAQAAELVGSALDRIRLGASATVVPLASRSTP
jgi:integrase